jgi:hypothetical protein
MSSRLRLAAALLAACLLGGCDSSEEPAPLPTRAPPQQAQLGWEEQLPETGDALVLKAHRLEVTDSGWEADVEVENRTKIAWRLGGPGTGIARSFGVMLFATNELEDLEQLSRDGERPGLRAARRFSPAPPPRLAPGARWRGTIAAPGPLAAGLYLRIVYGPFVAVGDPPEGMQPGFSWITDHALRLKG